MIIRKHFQIVIVCFFFVLGSCLSQKNITKQPVKDSFGKILYCPIDSDKTIYYLETGEKIIATNNGVEFCKGRDSLSNYLSVKYVNHPNYGWIDYNMHLFFVILFDKNLTIKEIRIVNGYDKYHYSFEDIFIEELKNTEGMWCKSKPGKDWYFYFHVQKVY